MKYAIIFLLLFLAGILAYQYQAVIPYFRTGDWHAIQETLGQEWQQLLFVTFLLMILQNIVSFIPFLFLTMFNIWLYGFVYGYLWSLLGNFLGSVVVFYFARYGFQSWTKKYNHLKFKQDIERNGFKFVLLTRLLPFVPSSLINIVSGISNIKAREYIFATFIGNTTFVFILSLFSVGVISLERKLIVYVLLSTFIIVLVALKFIKVKKDKAVGE